LRFSEYFRIEPEGPVGWFDPLLNADTLLFVDPFRVFLESDRRWVQAHARLIDFFNLVMETVADSGFNHTSSHWRAAQWLMRFPEPAEFCLGYAAGTTSGSGTGERLGKEMLKAAERTLRAGLMDGYRHFEELRLFEPQIGSDRISDITCNVLKREFIAYTQEVAQENDIPMEEVPVRHANWDRANRRWLPQEPVLLPRNPFVRRPRGILLVPERFLRRLPTIDPDDFYSYALRNANEQLRDEFNYHIARNLDKREIGARIARAHPDLAREYVDFREHNPKPAYNVQRDPDLRTRWYERGRDVAQSRSWEVPDREGEFASFIRSLVDAFAHWVEEEDGWRVLTRDDGQPRAEKIAQSVFRAMTTTVCREHDIDPSKEPNAGRGPVDFKFSRGWSARALVEMKLAHNTRVGHGITIQTPQYLRSEQIRIAYFVYVGFREQDFAPTRLTEIREMAQEVSEAAPEIDVRLKLVDARPKPSASRS
jgi:hypothetical protein